MTMIDINCWERGCACYDSRIADETVEVVLAKQGEPVALQYPQKEIDWQREQQIKAQSSTPPQRTWVGLTDEEILKFQDIVPNTLGYDLIQFAKAIEAKLKEKNT